MVKLVKIKEVLLYVGYTAGAHDGYLMKKFLKDNNIKFTLMNYADDSQHSDLLKAFESWTWGRSENARKETFSDFPFLTWKELYDDFESAPEVVHTLDDLQSSNLVKYKDLIV